MTEKCGRF